MSSSQANVLRKKVISSKEISARRDETQRKASSSKKAEEKNVSSNLVSNRRSSSKSDKSLIKQDSVGSSTSRTRTLIDKNVNSSISSISKVQSTISHKVTPSPRSSGNDIRAKLNKQNSDEKRGLTTIYMPKKSFTSKQSHQVKDHDSKPSGDSNIKRINGKSSKENTTTKVKVSSQGSSSKNRLPSRERRKSRTLSPSEVKMLNKKLGNHPNASSSSTLAKNKSPAHSSAEYEYEDDFEDYESDFQECTDSEASKSEDTSPISESEECSNSSEAEPVELKIKARTDVEKYPSVLPRKHVEEEMLDSGHYELQEARRRAARIDLMSASRAPRVPTQVLQRPIFLSGDDPSEKEVRSEVRSLPSSADEGFEDGRSGDFVKSPPISDSVSRIDTVPQNNKNKKISNAKLEPQPATCESKEKKESKYLIRGRQLLQMIKLDRVSWSLYESTPIPYEDFIRIHGKMNTRQISTQTNDDNLSIDIQTDEIESRNMWTQFPIVCKSNLKTNEDVKIFTKELIGVGSDDNNYNDLNPSQNRGYYDVLQLNDFLLNAGKLMLALLEGKSSVTINLSDSNSDNHLNLPFSEGSIKLSVASVMFLANRNVTLIRYSEVSNKILLTIHDRADEDVQIPNNEDSYVTDCYIGCLWNIFESSKPVKIFYSSSNICACCFHPTNYNIVFAGLEDGSLSLWDLGENEFYHRRVIDKDNEVDWILRSPTFNSGCDFDENNLGSSQIVALTILSKMQSDSGEVIGKFMPVEVCSLNERGNCVVWSVLKNFEGSATDDLGQSWWGKLRLIKSHEIVLNIDKRMHDNFMQEFKEMCVDNVNANSLYICCNTNKILHATRIGKNAQPRYYVGYDYTGGMTCIEKCPFNEPYFLVGCEDGTILLFSTKLEKPLLQLKNSNSTAAIKIIQWSKSKPLTIYVLDIESKIHIWDLNKSDITPTFSISLKSGHIDNMQLSPCRSNHDLINQYMALSQNNGSVEIYKLNQQFQYSNHDDMSSELEVLLKYLSIC